jgi:glyoxylase-like metal-dependent hydrolase (beta-lactamase superfamily II)
LLIDTGEPNVQKYLQNLIKTLELDGSKIHAIIATHWHMDHVGGISQIRNHFKEVWTINKCYYHYLNKLRRTSLFINCVALMANLNQVAMNSLSLRMVIKFLLKVQQFGNFSKKIDFKID